MCETLKFPCDMMTTWLCRCKCLVVVSTRNFQVATRFSLLVICKQPRASC